MVSDDILNRISRIESQLEIQQLVCRYARAMDARDIDEITTLFSPETNFGDDGIGAEGARSFYERVLSDFYRSFHQVCGHVIEITNSSEARGTVYCRADHEVGESWILNLMIYYDRYVQREGRWQFKGRRPRYLYVGDALVSPSSVAFNHWPGREGALVVDLPNSHQTWKQYWDKRSELVPNLTRLP